MILGFTGSRVGGTDYADHERQQAVLAEIKRLLAQLTMGVHGDCIGWDYAFDQMCRAVGLVTGIRPCTISSMRARCDLQGARVLAEPKPRMARNRDIVADADVMIACPPNYTRIKSGSGTWATIGFAKKKGIPLLTVFPDGTSERSGQTPLFG